MIYLFFIELLLNMHLLFSWKSSKGMQYHFFTMEEYPLIESKKKITETY